VCFIFIFYTIEVTKCTRWTLLSIVKHNFLSMYIYTNKVFLTLRKFRALISLFLYFLFLILYICLYFFLSLLVFYFIHI
jgi:hypothetical protein